MTVTPEIAAYVRPGQSVKAFAMNRRAGILPFDIGQFLATGERHYLTDWLQKTP